LFARLKYDREIDIKHASTRGFIVLYKTMDIENNPKRRMRCKIPSKDNHYIYDASIKFSDRTSSFAMSYKKEDALDRSLVKVIGITSEMTEMS